MRQSPSSWPHLDTPFVRAPAKRSAEPKQQRNCPESTSSTPARKVSAQRRTVKRTPPSSLMGDAYWTSWRVQQPLTRRGAQRTRQSGALTFLNVNSGATSRNGQTDSAPRHTHISSSALGVREKKMSEAVELDGWTHVNSGKVRDLYQSEDGRVLLMVTSDRISAYDYILPTEIPGKGLVLTGLSTWWMNKLDSIVGNHLLDEPVPAQVAGRAVVCKKLTMYPIECVVRGYLTGSGLAEYKQSGTVCEIRLPEGLTEASKLPEPILSLIHI